MIRLLAWLREWRLNIMMLLIGLDERAQDDRSKDDRRLGTELRARLLARLRWKAYRAGWGE